MAPRGPQGLVRQSRQVHAEGEARPRNLGQVTTPVGASQAWGCTGDNDSSVCPHGGCEEEGGGLRDVGPLGGPYSEAANNSLLRSEVATSCARVLAPNEKLVQCWSWVEGAG